MNTAAQFRPPRQYFNRQVASVSPLLPGIGLPQDRHARIAARRSFVELKQQFMAAIEAIDGRRGQWLRHQARQAQEPVDLWLLRGAVFAELERLDDYSRRTRDDLNRVLDSVFPDEGLALPYGLRD
jgi:hypothetical protein